jgi:hypothetical protein
MTKNKLLELVEKREYTTVLNEYQKHSLENIAEAADFLREKNFFKVAVPLYSFLLKKDCASDYHFGIGQCYGKSYDYGLSLWHLEKAFSLHKERSGANYYAYILERNSQNGQAGKWYEKALSNGYEHDLWTLSHYAYFLEKNNQKDQATHYYQQVLEMNSAYTWAIKRYALFLFKESYVQQSLELLQTALKEFPQNLFIKLNYLEYLIICGMDRQYKLYLESLNYESYPLPFQVLVELIDYFSEYLLQGLSSIEKAKSYQQKANQLKDSIHRDFDDFTQILAVKNGDLIEWMRLIQLLIL